MIKKIKIIHYTSKFERAYKKLSSEEKLVAEETEKIFRQNPFDPRLKTHKLKGRLKNRWAFSLTYSQRVLFNFYNAKGDISSKARYNAKGDISSKARYENDQVIFYDIGDHQIYQ